MPIKELLEKSDIFPDPVLLVSVDGTIDAANAQFAEQVGLIPGSVAGRQLQSLAGLSPSLIEDYLRACARSDTAIRRSLSFKRRGRVVPFQSRGIAYPTDSAPAGARVLLYLEAGGRRSQRSAGSGSEPRHAEHARDWLAALVESAADAILSKRLDDIITSWNPAAALLFGYSAEEIIGQPITLIIPPEQHPEEEDTVACLRRGHRVERLETVRLTRSGQRIEVSLTASPIRNEAGEVVGVSEIARDITKRKGAELRLRDADRRKDEFLLTLGHELRNPLGIIRNATELLCRAEHPTAEARTACGILDRQIRLMSRLTDDLLNVSRVASGRLQLRREPLELGALLIEIVQSLRHQFESKDQSLTYSPAGVPIRVFGDRERLVQVFSNLLHNAHKYTQPGGRIEVALRREARNAVVSVHDDGQGIPPHLLDDVFRLFQQVGRESGRSSQGGLGIGLALARNLAHMHGGEIRASSAGTGRGSEFTVELPMLEEGEEAAAADTQAPAAQTVRKILIADDNRDAALSLSMLLANMGHQTRVAYDGLEALEIAREFHPQLAFLDLIMPKLNGYEVAQRLKSEDWARSTLLVALTSWREDSDRERAQTAGFDRYVLKPLQAETLRELLNAAPGAAAP